MEKNLITLFSQGDVTHWEGLPKGLSMVELIKLFGDPLSAVEDTLGYYPALKYDFTKGDVKGYLIAYVRQQTVVLIETKKLPDSGVLDELPKPDATLPNEILVEKAYATEYIYCKRGLNLTVAKSFDKNAPDEIIRCRGFEKINKPEEFGPRYYKSFESKISW